MHCLSQQSVTTVKKKKNCGRGVFYYLTGPKDLSCLTSIMAFRVRNKTKKQKKKVGLMRQTSHNCPIIIKDEIPITVKVAEE